MERQIGEIFELDGKTLQVIEHDVYCDGCRFSVDDDEFCINDDFDITGYCCAHRKDGKSVIFKEVKIK